MNHQWVFWVSLAVIHLNFLEFGETQKSWGNFSKRSTFTKSISSSQAHHLVCSRKKTLTQSLEIERLSLRDFFVLLEEHTYWIITMMNFNCILYCSTVFSWNKHCSTKQMQPWNCLIYSYSELNIGDLQGKKKKKKDHSDVAEMNESQFARLHTHMKYSHLQDKVQHCKTVDKDS